MRESEGVAAEIPYLSLVRNEVEIAVIVGVQRHQYAQLAEHGIRQGPEAAIAIADPDQLTLLLVSCIGRKQDVVATIAIEVYDDGRVYPVRRRGLVRKRCRAHVGEFTSAEVFQRLQVAACI